MTQQEFDTQKWYKDMPVYIDDELFFVKGVDFEEDMISVASSQQEVSTSYWFPFNEIKVKEIEQTADDNFANRLKTI